MFRISWIEHRLNVSILGKLGIEWKNRLERMIKRLYHRFFGHVTRRVGLERTVIKGLGKE